jgi:hypothetical protein
MTAVARRRVVIPANAGIPLLLSGGIGLDSGFRRNDGRLAI